MNAYLGLPKIAVAAFGLAFLLVTSPALSQHGGHGGGGHVGGGSHVGGHSSGRGGGGAHAIGGHSSGHSSSFASDGNFHSDGNGLSPGFADSFHTDHHFDPLHDQHPLFHHYHFFFRHHHFFGYAYFPFYSFSPWYASYPYSSYAYTPTPALSGLTLLAFLDNSIVAVADYWVENDELHYVTSNGTQYTVPLNQIDLDMTTQLNRERGIEFVLRTAPNTP